MSALVLYVRLHDGRYHGEGDWPPSPARLFQALVAGAGLSGPLEDADIQALKWLENQRPPLVAAPPAWQPRRDVLFYMPNNDSDAIGGDPMRMAKIRTATKVFRPYFFDAAVSLVYVWELAGQPGDEELAKQICSLSERLYQLGRGIDMAWAWGEVLEDGAGDEVLEGYPGSVFRPSVGRGKATLLCPCPGSLDSLLRRYQAFGKRFSYERGAKGLRVVYRKPPRPRFQLVSYNSPPSRQLYELRSPTEEGAFAAWPLVRTSALVVQLRDAAVNRLRSVLPKKTADIERALVGRKPDGTNDIRPEDRVRIIPLPSIGHVHADREIRRVLVEVPPTCPLRADDVFWAFSGLDVVDMESEEIQAILIRSDDEGFLRHYGLNGGEQPCVWRTVTPAVLPQPAARRRIDPSRRHEEAKGGNARRAEVERAAAAVCHALRHAGVRAEVQAMRVQREPFEGRGSRVEPFAAGTRFAKERLWHVEVVFKGWLSGPLVIGDGRFFGLGLMAPVSKSRCCAPAS